MLEELRGINFTDHGYAVLVRDLATQWLQSYPSKTKSFQVTEMSLRRMPEATDKPKVIHTHNSLEFGKACEEFSGINVHPRLTRSETNVIAERAVHRVKEGTSAVLLQSGLDENWWADSMECYTYLRNVQDLLSEGKTPYERRFGEPFEGPVVPFGAMVYSSHIVSFKACYRDKRTPEFSEIRPSFSLTQKEDWDKIPWMRCILLHEGYLESLYIFASPFRNTWYYGKSCTQNQGKNFCKWWADSVECYCYLRDVQDLLSDLKHLKTAIRRTFQCLRNSFRIGD